MTRMRYVKMDRIMNHMLIHALREVFRQEKEQGLPVDTTRDLVLKLAEQEEGKLYLTEAEHTKSVYSYHILSLSSPSTVWAAVSGFHDL